MQDEEYRTQDQEHGEPEEPSIPQDRPIFARRSEVGQSTPHTEERPVQSLSELPRRRRSANIQANHTKTDAPGLLERPRRASAVLTPLHETGAAGEKSAAEQPERPQTRLADFVPVAAATPKVEPPEQDEIGQNADFMPVSAKAPVLKRTMKPAFIDEVPSDTARGAIRRLLCVPVAAPTWTVWVVTIVAALWLGLFPLLCKHPDGYVQNTHFKWVATIVMSCITAAAALVTVPFARKHVKWSSAGRLLAIGFFAWMGLSMKLGSSASLTNNDGQLISWIGSGRYEGMSTQLCYLAVFLALSMIRPKLRTICCVAAAGVVVFFGIVMGQYAGYNVLSLFPHFPDVYNTRVTYEFQGTIGNIDMVSGYLCLVAPLLLGFWVCEGGNDRHGFQLSDCLIVLGGMISVLLLFMIEVQSGLLALGGCMVLLAGVMMHFPRMRSRGWLVLAGILLCFTLRKLIGLPWLDGMAAPWNLPQRADTVLPKCVGNEQIIFPWAFSWRKLILLIPALVCIVMGIVRHRHPGYGLELAPTIAIVLLVVLIAVLLVGVIDIPQSAGGVWEIHEVLNGRMADGFGSNRAGIWRRTLEMSLDHPLFGTGPDTFRALIGSPLAREGVTPGQTFDNPHNIYLAILMQNGLPALALFIAAMAVIVIRAARQREGLGLAAAVLAYLAQGMFSFSICLVTPMFWAILGLAVAVDVKLVEE